MTESTSGSIGPALGPLASTDHLLVACDFDGVLAPIVADPAAATPLPASMTALHALVDLPATTVAIVSGRELAQLDQMVPEARRFVLVGSHGAEVAGLEADGSGPGSSPEADAGSELLASTVAELRHLASRIPGLHIEPKAHSVATHLRRVEPDRRAEAEAEVDRVRSAWPGRVIEGKEVVELSLADDTKGDAIVALTGRTGATATIYFGDDVTDEDAFAVLQPGDVGVKVGDGPTAATTRVADPAAVAELLGALAAQRLAACQRD